jgi:hypothetical protein
LLLQVAKKFYDMVQTSQIVCCYSFPNFEFLSSNLP